MSGADGGNPMLMMMMMNGGGMNMFDNLFKAVNPVAPTETKEAE